MRRIVTTMLAVITLLVQGYGYAQTDNRVDMESPLWEQEMNDLIKQLSPYIQPDDQNPLHFTFNQLEAEKDGLSTEQIAIGKDIERVSRVYAKQRNDQGVDVQGLSIYGNWCGPAYGSGKPKDSLDLQCMQHDTCYREKGYFDCGCDSKLVSGIKANYSSMKPKERRMAMVIMIYFNAVPCISRK